MMRFVNLMYGKAITWLARQLTEERRRQAGPCMCVLNHGATLCDEAEINNFSQVRDNITIGQNSFVRGRLLTYAHGGRINIGEWCYIGVRSEIWSMESITIGNRVLISHDVNIHDGTAHSLDPMERYAHFRHIIEHGHPTNWKDLPGVVAAPVVIEDDVWISFGVTILRGVRIGKGSVVAAGSIVTRDVPSGTLYRCNVSPVLSPITPALPDRLSRIDQL